MIHHDYLLRLIEQFLRGLTEVSDLRSTAQPGEARSRIDAELHRLLGIDRESLLRLSTTETLARIVRSGGAYETRAKTLFVVALLEESGLLAENAADPAAARRARLQALQLLLESGAWTDDPTCPQFGPTIVGLVDSLADAPLPPELQTLLMAHFETVGEFAKAEDAYHAILDATGNDPTVLRFGIAFYERLLPLNDETLVDGNLPRPEVLQGLADLRARTTAGA